MMNGVKTTYTKDIDDLIYLLSCSLLGTTPDIERVNEMDLNYLYQLASFHSLVAMISFSLERAIPLPTQFEQDKKKAMRKLALFDIERKKIFQRMDEEKIWHMSLKGSVLKDDYPKFGMREMVDNDILCDSGRMADVKAIMEELTYLIPELLQLVDEGKMKMRPAVELSYLNVDFQRDVLENIELNDCTPSHAQTIRMRRLYEEHSLTPEVIADIMCEQKPNQRERIYQREDGSGYPSPKAPDDQGGIPV